MARTVRCSPSERHATDGTTLASKGRERKGANCGRSSNWVLPSVSFRPLRMCRRRIRHACSSAAMNPYRAPSSRPPRLTISVHLKAGERWRYEPPAGHTVLWVAVASGLLSTPEKLQHGKLATFEPSSGGRIRSVSRYRVRPRLGRSAPARSRPRLLLGPHVARRASQRRSAHIVDQGTPNSRRPSRLTRRKLIRAAFLRKRHRNNEVDECGRLSRVRKIDSC